VPARYAVLEEFARECRATEEELIELHLRWIRADATAVSRAQDRSDGSDPEANAEVEPEPSTSVDAAAPAPAAVTTDGRWRRLSSRSHLRS